MYEHTVILCTVSKDHYSEVIQEYLVRLTDWVTLWFSAYNYIQLYIQLQVTNLVNQVSVGR